MRWGFSSYCSLPPGGAHDPSLVSICGCIVWGLILAVIKSLWQLEEQQRYQLLWINLRLSTYWLKDKASWVFRTQTSCGNQFPKDWFWNTPLDAVLSTVDYQNKVISDITSGMFFWQVWRRPEWSSAAYEVACLWSALAAVNQHLYLPKTNFIAFVTPNALREKYCENTSFMELEVYVIYVSALHVINLEHGIPPRWMAVKQFLHFSAVKNPAVTRWPKIIWPDLF